MVFPATAIMPYGFGQNVTRITGLRRSLQSFLAAGSLRGIRLQSRPFAVASHDGFHAARVSSNALGGFVVPYTGRPLEAAVRRSSSSAAARGGTSRSALGSRSSRAARRLPKRCACIARAALAGAPIEFTID